MFTLGICPVLTTKYLLNKRMPFEKTVYTITVYCLFEFNPMLFQNVPEGGQEISVVVSQRSDIYLLSYVAMTFFLRQNSAAYVQLSAQTNVAHQKLVSHVH